MFSLLTAYRCILQPPSIRGYNSRRMYIKGVDQAHDLSKVLPEWHMMKLFMGGLGALTLGGTVFEFTLVKKVAVLEAHLFEMRRDIALIKGKLFGIPVSAEVLEALGSKGKEI
ncbi:hypothetical protein TWF225_010959 [Orbilia oligospora]|nr:hypothetical protein TWF225_010959 [Orbilia oligospora]KAF3265725.1 hypothetical protein TWF217_002266 [Orbilia oligospora]KAF3271575.1 hypothetical protein TWF128_000149 [Orbilia oligospora]KAF3295070.1 hypothetical protein TWF132_002393 [Orbilia oligospora]